MTPPRVATERAKKYIVSVNDPGSFCSMLAEDLVDARERIAELEATILNERGEGEPPSPGWGWTDAAPQRAGLHGYTAASTGGYWSRLYQDDDTAPLGVHYLVERSHNKGWTATVKSGQICPTGPAYASQVAATARHAMRGADAARVPG